MPAVTHMFSAARDRINTMPASGWVDSIRLAAGTAKTYVLPLDAGGSPARMLRIAPDTTLQGSQVDQPIYFSFEGAAKLPSGTDVLDGTAALNSMSQYGGSPYLPIPDGITEVSFICNITVDICIACWS